MILEAACKTDQVLNDQVMKQSNSLKTGQAWYL